MRSVGWIVSVLVLIAVVIGAGMLINDMSDRDRLYARVRALTGGDPDAGQAALERRPCGGCHQIPGVSEAMGKVGPPLSGWSGRVYIDGRLQNTPENLERWILNPHEIDPQSAMPPTGVTPLEARNMAAYLYTLQ